MKNNSKIKATIYLFGIALLVSGCASYRAIPLNNMCADTPTFQLMRTQDVVIAAKAFDKSDCKKYLDRDVMSKGYQPVQLSIDNKTDKNYLFSLSRISLPCASPEEVAETVHTSTVARAASYGAAAIVFWPFAIPAVVDGVRSAQANKALDHDFIAKSAKDQVIESHSHVNMLLFVPRDNYSSSFQVTLVDLKSNQPHDFIVRAVR